MKRCVKFLLGTLLCLCLLIIGCKTLNEEPLVTNIPDSEVKTLVRKIINDVKSETGFDSRETVFTADFSVDKGTVTLEGQCSDPGLKQLLLAKLYENQAITIIDSIEELPSKELGVKCWAVVKSPVLNMGDAPGFNTGKRMVTQARLGDVLFVLKEQDGWYLVQMEDDYLGWVDPQDIWLVNKDELEQFFSGQVLLVTSKKASGYTEPDGLEITELIQGSVLPAAFAGTDDKYVLATIPGGQQIYVNNQDVKIFESKNHVFSEQKGAQAVIDTAMQYIGLPYLWGGTTAYGFDCSGLTQFCLKYNGYFVRRDANMQYQQGAPVTTRDDLIPGDLVFFSTYQSGASHVGIYIGNQRYIHSSGSLGLAISSFNKSDPEYSQSLDENYLGARRIIPN